MAACLCCLPLVKYEDITAKQKSICHDFEWKKHPLNKVNLHEMQNKKNKLPWKVSLKIVLILDDFKEN